MSSEHRMSSLLSSCMLKEKRIMRHNVNIGRHITIYDFATFRKLNSVTGLKPQLKSIICIFSSQEMQNREDDLPSTGGVLAGSGCFITAILVAGDITGRLVSSLIEADDSSSNA